MGGFGNLLETLLCKRSPKRKALTIQSDLSTVNLVADEELRRRFDIRYVGCASHAPAAPVDQRLAAILVAFVSFEQDRRQPCARGRQEDTSVE